MRLIESLGDKSVQVDGVTFPVPSIVEDREGTRFLLLSDSGRLPLGVWVKAHSQGVRALIIPGEQFGVIPTEVFLEDRVEHPLDRTYSLPQPSLFEGFPTLDDLYSQAPVESSGTFVHLHTHSELSALDGLSSVEEIVTTVKAQGHTAVAITDHGVCASHPQLQSIAEAEGIKPIFGQELNLVEDRHYKEKDGLYEYWHLILWAMDDEGLRNLWAITTEANREGFYGRPRADWNTLERFNEGVMASTGCLRGPLSRAILDGDIELARMRLAMLYDIFGDRLYIEIQTNSVPEQRTVNEVLVGFAREYDLPLVAASDSHYATKEDKKHHKVWIAVQTNKELSDDADLFAGDSDYHLMSESEVREALSYLPDDVIDEAISNTVKVSDRCNARLAGDPSPPIYSKAATPEEAVDKDVDRLIEICSKNWSKCEGNEIPESEYEDRFEREFRLLMDKGYVGYFLMVSDYCLDPSTPVLTSDMRWVEVGKLEVGDKVAGFDEDTVIRDGNQKGHRYWRDAEVVNTRRVVLPTYRVTLEDGTQTIVSEDHQWLVAKGQSRNQWVKTKDLIEFGVDPRYNVPKEIPVRAQRLVHEWDELQTWEAGYIAGILDGEGSFGISPMNNGGHSWKLSFAQNEGEVLDTSLRILDSWGFDYSVKPHGKRRVRVVHIKGGRSEMMRLLGTTRPRRLLAKLDIDLLGRVVSIEKPAIVKVEPLGLGEVVALETTTGTLVAQGIAHHNCLWAREHGILVGPGRGSGAASLVSYLCGITGIDPLEADLLFERFLTQGRKALPDFDVDFPASKRQELTDYITDRYGAENVVRVGTHIRVKNKGVVRDMARVFKKSQEVNYADINAISKIIDEAEADSSGLGMSWEDLWDEYGDVLKPYRVKYPELFSHADKIVGRLRTYGKHAAGVVIAPDAKLTENLPLRVQGKDETDMIAEFDMESLEELGLIKFDLLTLRTLDTIQQTIDIIHEETGERLDPWNWREEYNDPEVWDEISAGHTLGMFQIETHAGIRTCKRFKPRSLNDLSDVITLVRPGPVRSGLTETYFQRRMGNEPVTYLDERMEPILRKTEGCMIYQEQVMKLTMELAGYNETEADAVRKILGKKKIELVEEEGKKFVSRAVEHGTDAKVAATIWEQMAEFSRYSFNLAHAYGYAMLGYWTGYLKVRYPIQFLTAALSTVDKGRIPEFINEARRMGYKVLPPDINASGKGFRASDGVIRYGFDGVKGVGAAAVEALIEGQPYTSYEDFLERKGKKANVGIVKLLAKLGAFESIAPSRRKEIEEKLDWEGEGLDKHCRYMTIFDVEGRKTVENVGCSFDWDTEPRELTPTGQKKTAKPKPKICTVRCRQFVPFTFTPGEGDFTKREVMDREMELLGIHLTYTPFDQVPAEFWDKDAMREMLGSPVLVGSEISDAALGDHVAVATISRIRKHVAKNGKNMAFIGMHAVDQELDVTVFNTEYKKFHREMVEGEVYLSIIHKNERGLSLVSIESLGV